MLKFGDNLTFFDGLIVSVIAILIVFVVLSLIAIIISLVGKVLKEEKVAKEKESVKPVQPVKANKVDLSSVVNDELKLVATIVASIEANKNDEDVIYKITKIKEI